VFGAVVINIKNYFSDVNLSRTGFLLVIILSQDLKTIPLDGAAIVFDFVSTEKESSNTRRSQEIGIDVHFFQVFRWFRGVNWSIALFGQHRER
jgi:hypothetical protein